MRFHKSMILVLLFSALFANTLSATPDTPQPTRTPTPVATPTPSPTPVVKDFLSLVSPNKGVIAGNFVAFKAQPKPQFSGNFKVAFYVDGVWQKDQDRETAPYVFETVFATPGAHTVKAEVVFDDSPNGFRPSSILDVEVGSFISLQSPQDSLIQVLTPIELKSNTTLNKRFIKKVAWYRNGNWIKGADDKKAPYTLETKLLEVGDHTIGATIIFKDDIETYAWRSQFNLPKEVSSQIKLKADERNIQIGMEALFGQSLGALADTARIKVSIKPKLATSTKVANGKEQGLKAAAQLIDSSGRPVAKAIKLKTANAGSQYRLIIPTNQIGSNKLYKTILPNGSYLINFSLSYGSQVIASHNQNIVVENEETIQPPVQNFVYDNRFRSSCAADSLLQKSKSVSIAQRSVADQGSACLIQLAGSGADNHVSIVPNENRNNAPSYGKASTEFMIQGPGQALFGMWGFYKGNNEKIEFYGVQLKINQPHQQGYLGTIQPVKFVIFRRTGEILEVTPLLNIAPRTAYFVRNVWSTLDMELKPALNQLILRYYAASHFIPTINNIVLESAVPSTRATKGDVSWRSSGSEILLKTLLVQ